MSSRRKILPHQMRIRKIFAKIYSKGDNFLLIKLCLQKGYLGFLFFFILLICLMMKLFCLVSHIVLSLTHFSKFDFWGRTFWPG